MLQLFQYALFLIGVVYFITQASVCMPLRIGVSIVGNFLRLGAIPTLLIYCPMCTSFWVGIILGVTGWYPFETGHPIVLDGFESGFVAMAIVTLWDHATGRKSGSVFESERMFLPEGVQGVLAPQKKAEEK